MKSHDAGEIEYYSFAIAHGCMRVTRGKLNPEIFNGVIDLYKIFLQ